MSASAASRSGTRWPTEQAGSAACSAPHLGQTPQFEDLSRDRCRASRCGRGVSTCSSGGDALRRRRLAPRRERDTSRCRHEGRADGQACEFLFRRALPQTLADALQSGGDALFGIEGSEHTAQVEQDRREWREWRFRWGEEDRARLREAKEELRKAGEPNVFLAGSFLLADHGARRRHLGAQCGVPAQHAAHAGELRAALGAGRAVRPGSPGSELTARPRARTTKYYFGRREAMVSGIVRPPLSTSPTATWSRRTSRRVARRIGAGVGA